MKKVKIMLLSLALFAVVGGALAFKAKFSKTFCTTDLVANCAATVCPTSIGNVTTDIEAQVDAVCYTLAQTYTTAGGETIGCAYNLGDPGQNDFRTANITCNVGAKVTTE